MFKEILKVGGAAVLGSMAADKFGPTLANQFAPTGGFTDFQSMCLRAAITMVVSGVAYSFIAKV